MYAQRSSVIEAVRGVVEHAREVTTEW